MEKMINHKKIDMSAHITNIPQNDPGLLQKLKTTPLKFGKCSKFCQVDWKDAELIYVDGSATDIIIPLIVDKDGNMTDSDIGFLARLVTIIQKVNMYYNGIDMFLSQRIHVRHIMTLLVLGFEVTERNVPQLFKIQTDHGTFGVPDFKELIGKLPVPTSTPNRDWIFTDAVSLTHEEIIELDDFLNLHNHVLSDQALQISLCHHWVTYVPLLIRHGASYQPDIILHNIMVGAYQSTTHATHSEGNGYWGAMPQPFDLNKCKAQVAEIRALSTKFLTANAFTNKYLKDDMPMVAYVMDNDYLDWLVSEGFRPTFITVQQVAMDHRNESIPIEVRKRILLWLDAYMPDMTVTCADKDRHLTPSSYICEDLYDFCIKEVGMIQRAHSARETRQQTVYVRQLKFQERYGLSEQDVDLIQTYLGRTNGVCPNWMKTHNHDDCPEWPKCKMYHGPIEDTYRVKQCTKLDCNCTDYHFATQDQLTELNSLKKYMLPVNCGGKDVSTYEVDNLRSQLESNPYSYMTVSTRKDVWARPITSVNYARCHGKNDDSYCPAYDDKCIFMVNTLRSVAYNERCRYYCCIDHLRQCESKGTPYVLKEPHAQRDMIGYTPQYTPDMILRKYFNDGRSEYDNYSDNDSDDYYGPIGDYYD
jgi:hypothetical protein